MYLVFAGDLSVSDRKLHPLVVLLSNTFAQRVDVTDFKLQNLVLSDLSSLFASRDAQMIETSYLSRDFQMSSVKYDTT